MEPPAKRRRISPIVRSSLFGPSSDTNIEQTNPESGILNSQEDAIVGDNSVPTRILARRTVLDRSIKGREAQPQKLANKQIFPRSPEVTVTANIVNIAILDGSEKTSFTQIAAPTSDIQLPISGVGTLTVAAFPQETSLSRSGSSGGEAGASSSGSSGPSASGTILSPSVPANTTSTEKTVTVTATSLLKVTMRNGTVTLTSASRQRTIFTAEGFTTTLDDAPSNTVSSGYRFGDINTSLTSLSTDVVNGQGATAAVTSSTSQPTSSGTSSGPGIVLTPQQQQVVGGVVGGVAGVALVLLGILYFLKWYRHHLKALGRLPEQSGRHRQLPSGDEHEYIAPSAMTQRSGPGLVPVAAFKQSLQKLRPHSTYTNHTDHSSLPPPESEKSFQRISGRKIPSVLLTGGNGYDDQAPVSPMSDHSFSRSQTSFFRDGSSTNNQFPPNADSDLISEQGTPPRARVSPFLDPPDENHSYEMSHVAGSSTHTRDFAALNASRSQLTIKTGSLTAFSPPRHSEGSITIRPSPARTPTTNSPTSSSLRLPMYTPPMMSGDVPEMPPLHPWRHNMGPQKFSDEASSVQRSLGPRSVSGISARSSGSVGGRFREEI